MSTPVEAVPVSLTAEELLASAEREVPCEWEDHPRVGSGPATLLGHLRCPAHPNEGRVWAWCVPCLADLKAIHLTCTDCSFHGRGAAFVGDVRPLHPSGTGA